MSNGIHFSKNSLCASLMTIAKRYIIHRQVAAARAKESSASTIIPPYIRSEFMYTTMGKGRERWLSDNEYMQLVRMYCAHNKTLLNLVGMFETAQRNGYEGTFWNWKPARGVLPAEVGLLKIKSRVKVFEKAFLNGVRFESRVTTAHDNTGVMVQYIENNATCTAYGRITRILSITMVKKCSSFLRLIGSRELD